MLESAKPRLSTITHHFSLRHEAMLMSLFALCYLLCCVPRAWTCRSRNKSPRHEPYNQRSAAYKASLPTPCIREVICCCGTHKSMSDMNRAKAVFGASAPYGSRLSKVKRLESASTIGPPSVNIPPPQFASVIYPHTSAGSFRPTNW